MASVQVTTAARIWALGAAAALVGTTTLVSVPATATAAEPVVAPTEGTVVAPSSAVRLTGGVGLTDDAVYGETAAGIVAFPRDGSATDWSPVTVDGAPLTGHLLGTEGDALLVATADGTDTLAWRTDDGAWASRTVAAGTRLGHGGHYVVPPQRHTVNGTLATDVVSIPDFDRVFTHETHGSAEPVALTGTTLWRSSLDDPDETRSWDVVSGAQTTGGPDVDGSESTTLSAVGRWGLLTGTHVVARDLAGVYTDVDLPAGFRNPAIAAGAVAGLTAVSGSAGTLTVRELTGERRTQTYGAGRLVTPDVDDAGTSLAFVGTDGRARIADLRWTSPAATALVDRLAPATPTLVTDPLVRWTKVTATAFGTLDRAEAPFRSSGAPVATMQYRQRPSATSAYGPWQTYDWRAIERDRDEFSAQVETPRGATTCFRVREVDPAGNATPWATACTTVDGTPPTVKVTGPKSAVKVTEGKAVATVTYGSTAVDLESFDVRYKTAPKGSTTYGSWVYPTSWQATTRTSQKVTLGTGQRVCFAVRARDDFVGPEANVSDWSSSRCTFADGTRPKLTKVVGPPRWYGVPKSGKVTASIRFAGSDDHALRFDVVMATATATGSLSPWKTVRSATTTRSYSHTVLTGRELCYRVRARDTAGNVSAWSSSRCINVAAPASSRALQADHRASIGGVTVVALKSCVPATRCPDRWSAVLRHERGTHGIRLQVRTCRTCGTFHVQVENKIMAVRTAAKKAGWKWVTLTWKRDDSLVFFDEMAPYPHPKVTMTYIRSWALIR